MSEHRILFVCLGNICRSPTAEAVMQGVLIEHGLQDRVEVDSAGTIAYHAGEPADQRMQRAAGERGYSLDGISRKVTRDDFQDFDLVIAMDLSNQEDLRDMAPQGARDKIHMLSDFLPEGSPRDVPDPYYGGAQGFENVLDLIEEACPRIIEDLLGEELPE